MAAGLEVDKVLPSDPCALRVSDSSSKTHIFWSGLKPLSQRFSAGGPQISNSSLVLELFRMLILWPLDLAKSNIPRVRAQQAISIYFVKID